MSDTYRFINVGGDGDEDSAGVGGGVTIAKRIVTKTKKWNAINSSLRQNNVQLLNVLLHWDTVGGAPHGDEAGEGLRSLIVSQINAKISGYKSQDKVKKLYDENNFVDFETIKAQLVNCDLKCYYCNEEIALLYENVRYKKQWSIDRIDNSLGHNKDNFVIACLECNLHRRCKNIDKFDYGVGLVIEKMDE